MRSSDKRATGTQPLVLRIGRARIKGQGSLSSWVWKATSLVLTDEALVTPDYKIPLGNITKVERVDLKPYCLLLEAKGNRRYHLSFENDGELYDWQEDVYSRCPLIGGGNPFGFVHHVHVGFDPVSGAFAGLPQQWSDHLTPGSQSEPSNRHEKLEMFRKRDSASTSNPLHDTPTLPYIAPPAAATKSGPRPRSPAVLDGHHSIKVDGLFSGWIWKARWLVLGSRTLTIYKSKRSTIGISIPLREITSIERAMTRTYCLVIETSTGKRYFLSFPNDELLYGWRDAIYGRSPLAVSNPVNFVHNVHIGIDPATGEFTGLPEQWKQILQNA
ncbi:Serine/threonine-protein kinase SKM1 [Hypsizygus marmoreus]|uniref:non-specific serine/threonine protein kinase n=1 Tax=Hypsizygus marmoreus TaxID=39966 RepID=A0A369K1D4_HYPMA|nr:Serine/threonine-protein kinase SKM1 [Hypsizygus marmoreus]